MRRKKKKVMHTGRREKNPLVYLWTVVFIAEKLLFIHLWCYYLCALCWFSLLALLKQREWVLETKYKVVWRLLSDSWFNPSTQEYVTINSLNIEAIKIAQTYGRQPNLGNSLEKNRRSSIDQNGYKSVSNKCTNLCWQPACQ